MKKYLCLLLSFVLLGLPACAKAEVSGVALWQDPSNVVLVWDKEEGKEYSIYRSETADGEYVLLGSSSVGSFRDDSVQYPDPYYYKIKKDNQDIFGPIKATVEPDKLTSVSVIMYHNFITSEDVENGVVFDEYSIHPKEFEEDLIWLKNNGYVTITSDDLIEHLEGKKTLPQKAVILSIDDGTWGVYKNAWPLLKKYNMKADLNVIGAQIDATWESLHEGGSRDQEAPYCTWEELAEMSESGEINICSHTYGLHRYNQEKRIGMSMMEHENAEEFAQVVKKDYDLAVSSIEGWTGEKQETVAYPYSKRSKESDKVVLENTGYKILMAGEGARGTAGNYFVKGCDFSEQLTLMSRPCRMEGTPIRVYLERIEEKDAKNGVNIKQNSLYAEDTDEIALDYQIFDDVKIGEWFAGSVYYAYLNSLMLGVSNTQFAPHDNIDRAMAAALLNRLAGNQKAQTTKKFADANGTEWWYSSALWADENQILSTKDNQFNPEETISREALAQAMYQCGSYLKFDMEKRTDLNQFTDSTLISNEHKEAVSWAVASKIFKGNADGSFHPKGQVTRAEMSMILRNWLVNTNRQEK